MGRIGTSDRVSAQKMFQMGRKLIEHIDIKNYSEGVLLLKQAAAMGSSEARLELATLPSHIDPSLSGLSREEMFSILLGDAKIGGIGSAVEIFYSFNDLIDSRSILELMLIMKEFGHNVDSYISDLESEISGSGTADR